MSKTVSSLPISNPRSFSPALKSFQVSDQASSETDTHEGRDLVNNCASVGEQTSQVPAPPTVFYIDKQRLGRDCVSNQLAAHLPEWRIECASSIRDLQRSDFR